MKRLETFFITDSGHPEAVCCSAFYKVMRFSSIDHDVQDYNEQLTLAIRLLLLLLRFLWSLGECETLTRFIAYGRVSPL